jgi:hypothetical protein
LSLLPLAFRIPDQAAKLFWNIAVPVQGFPSLHVFGKHHDVMRLKGIVFAVVLPAVVGAFCTRRPGTTHEEIRLPDARPSLQTNSPGF